MNCRRSDAARRCGSRIDSESGGWDGDTAQSRVSRCMRRDLALLAAVAEATLDTTSEHGTVQRPGLARSVHREE